MRNQLRQSTYNQVVFDRQQKCLALLHKDSKVVQAPIFKEEEKRFNFLDKFVY